MTRRMVVPLLAVVLIAAGSPHLVLGKCNPAVVNPARNNNTEHYYWVGAQQGSGGPAITSAESNIWNYSPYVPQGRFSWSWVMLTAGGSYLWAQIGPHEVYNSRDLHIQTANGSAGSIWDMNTPAQPLGFSTDVRINFSPFGGDLFTFYVNDTAVLTKQLSWQPNDAQFYSEIPSLATQLMGARTNSVSFTGNRIQYSGSWHNVANSVTSTNSTYFKFGGTGYNFYTWDDTCQS
ncbi:MAG: hypothetical protein HY263_06750 [Chloroflexi bacterium]|nr:hypothetical protein [Chloroflexota bacterium]